MLDKLIEFDTQFFLKLNGVHNDFFDGFMFFITQMEVWIPLYAVIIYFIIRKFKWHSVVVLISIGILITLADQISVKGFKEVFERLRPCHNPALEGLVHTVRGKCGGSFGFVSSHAANTFALATFLSFLYKKRWLTISIFAWAAAVSYSRIYLGVHFPGDILGGATLGAFLGIIIYTIYLRIPEFTSFKHLKNKD